jgi:hypothetical protein
MITSHDDDADAPRIRQIRRITTWRDLADQLTPEQICEIEYCEREQIPPGIASPEGHLNHARKLAELNIARAMLADMALPADAVGEVDDWIDVDDGVYQRGWTAWTDPGGQVSVYGVQSSDGTVERDIIITVGDEPLSAEDARELAGALIDAAAELDRLAAQR